MDAAFYEQLRCIMRNIRANDRMPSERPFEMGNNVLVVGRPFWSNARQQVQVHAYQMYEDAQCSRDLEIAFLNNLATMYDTRYDLNDLGDQT